MLKQLNVLKNMKLWMKNGFVILLMVIPIVSLLYFFLSSKQETITFARQEILGVEYLVPLKGLLEHVAQHRGLTALQFAGDKSAQGQLASVREAIEKDLQALETVDQRVGKQLGTTEKRTALTNAGKTCANASRPSRPSKALRNISCS